MSSIKLKVGDLAPDFTAVVQFANTQKTLSLAELLASGQKVLLIFYPKDQTPGCTRQLCGVRDVYPEYLQRKVTILGVNPGDASSHQKFIQQQGYDFGLVVDKDGYIRELYGAVTYFFGHKITKRGVFLINENGQIIYIHWGQHDNQKIFALLDKQNL